MKNCFFHIVTVKLPSVGYNPLEKINHEWDCNLSEQVLLTYFNEKQKKDE